jgi:transglutaminase-like putative cysteine protease
MPTSDVSDPGVRLQSMTLAKQRIVIAAAATVLGTGDACYPCADRGAAMTILAVRHVTTYQYTQPVAFGEHRIMLRPREYHDQRVLEAKLEITPQPTSLLWTQDTFGNHIGSARFAGRARALRFASTARLKKFPTEIVEMEIEDFARTCPFGYRAKDMPDVAPFVAPQLQDGDCELRQWLRTFLSRDEPTPTLALLIKLNRTIRETFTHMSRHEKGVQDPLLTLHLRRGSCRDLAVLMIEAVRSLGLAARFISGYLHLPDDNDDAHGGGNMHAWVQVYLPGPGWLDFDPASGIVGNRDLIRVAAVRVPAQAIPLHGTWTGFPSDYLAMKVEVKVVAADAQGAKPRRASPKTTM